MQAAMNKQETRLADFLDSCGDYTEDILIILLHPCIVAVLYIYFRF